MKSKKPIVLMSLSGIALASALNATKPDFTNVYDRTAATAANTSNVYNYSDITYNSYQRPTHKSDRTMAPYYSESTTINSYEIEDNTKTETTSTYTNNPEISYNTTATITNEYESFLESAANINVTYAYASYYNIDEAFNRTGATVSNNPTTLICSINSIPSESLLKQTILSNNEKFLATNKNGYYRLSESRINEVVSIIISSLNENYNILSKESKERVYEQLAHLTVVGADTNNPAISNTEYNAMYSENGLLIIDEDVLKKYYSDGDNAIQRTIAHEVAHIYQREYKQNRTSYTRIGVSQYWDNLTVNPLIWKFITESTAESNSMKQFNASTPLVYSKYYKRLQSLNLVALINPNYDERAYENANMNFDTNAIFNIYNAKTYQEKLEIAEMLYSIDIIDSERGDFYLSYRGDNNREVLKVSLLSSAMFTNSRYFYTNLAERIENGKVSFEDVVYLIKVFETDLNSQLPLSTNPSTYQEFINKYTELQKEFFDYLSTKYNISSSDLMEQYRVYATSSNTTMPSLSWLDNDEKTFIQNEYNMDKDYQNLTPISSYATQSGLSR